MELYSSNEHYKLYHGNMLDMLSVIEENSVDSIVTDPPYELGFMNKSWDKSGIAFQKETWEKCLKVLKPGGHMLVFGGSRTYHRIACAIEDAGFEIRDCIMWIYSSGFPKSLNIGLAIDKKSGVESKVIGIKEHCKKDFKEANLYAQDEANKNNTKCFGYGTEILKQAQNEFSGWGTQLKPAYEPIIVARKPVEGTIVDNVMKYGAGGINIDECRVGDEEVSTHKAPKGTFAGGERDRGSDTSSYETHSGRFPANIIHDGSEEAISGFPISGSGKGGTPYNYAGKEYDNSDTSMFNGDKPQAPSNYNDIGSAARYFYCAKASKKDRDEGMPADKHNTHVTVKPVSLMQYLIRLVTPNNGTVLDPFNGSGSTGKAAMYENKEGSKNYKYIGIELTDEYLPISKARIEYTINGEADYADEEVKPESAIEEKDKSVGKEINLWE